MNHLLNTTTIPYHDLQETPLSNAGISQCSVGSYLKCDNGKYCAGYAVTLFDIIEVTPLPLATWAQEANYNALTQARTLARGQGCQHLYR